MNLPGGKLLIKQEVAKNIDLEKMFYDLFDKEFSGYVASTTFVEEGFVEGFLTFKKGLLLGALFYHRGLNKQTYGKKALEYVFNILLDEKSIVDVSELGVEQADLMLVFNQKLLVSPPINKKTILPLLRKSYNKELFSNLSKEKEEDSQNIISKIKFFIEG